MRFTILGEEINHSLSPIIFKQFFENEKIKADYDISNIQQRNLTNFVDYSKNNLVGYNVTSPFKTSIIKYLDMLDDTAKIAKAVNVVQVKNRKLIGYNSDIYGAKIAIESMNDPNFSNIIIFGNGGVTPSIIYVLQQYFVATNIYVVTSNFSNKVAGVKYISADKLLAVKNVTFVINCSLPSKKHNMDIDFTNDCVFFDLSYIKSQFQMQLPKNIKFYNGELMLLHQARKAFQIWFDYLPNVSQVKLG